MREFIGGLGGGLWGGYERVYGEVGGSLWAGNEGVYGEAKREFMGRLGGR